MKSANQTTITLLRSILRQRIKIEKMGVSRKQNSQKLAIIAGDYLNHINMFESDNQVKSFVKKNIHTIFDICVNPQKSHTLQILIELSFLDEKNKVEIKSKI